jgi:calcineurin-like phosphoesterase family protein
MSNIFFTSDLHIGHKNILKLGSGRPFSTIDEHDNTLIQNWNSVVKDEDIIYHLGDFAFCCSPNRTLEVLEQLNGKINFIWGNHDQNLMKLSKLPLIYGSEKYNFLGDYAYIRCPDKEREKGYQGIVLMHYPLVVWYKVNKGVWHLHGHCHQGLDSSYYEGSPKLDVGVDGWSYTPVSYETVKFVLEAIDFIAPDHHVKGSL